MRIPKPLPAIMVLFSLQFLPVACLTEEDPGPLQLDEKNYQFFDFERLDVGNAFVLTVVRGEAYRIQARGDRRNLDDLSIEKHGSTLKINFVKSGEHNHTTYLDITMPVFAGGDFSGASNFTITGFDAAEKIDLALSGASVGQLGTSAEALKVSLAGASRLECFGKVSSLVVRASGASEFQAFALASQIVDAEASGASVLRLFAEQSLKAVASGASAIYYKGQPAVNASVTGASMVKAY